MAEQVNNPWKNVPLIPAEPVRAVEAKVTTFIAQQLSGGTATERQVYEDIDDGAEDDLFEAGSQMAEAIRNFRKVNDVSQVNAIALDDIAGTAATAIVDFTGSTATAAGTLQVYLTSKDSEHRAQVAIAIGDDATVIGTTLVTAVATLTRRMATAVNTTGSVELTALNSGTVANSYNLIVEGSVAGVTVALTGWAGGATDPVITSIEDLMEDYRTDIVAPNELNLTDIKAWLDDRFNTENNVLDGVLFTGVDDSKANLVILGNALNSQSFVILGDKPVDTPAIKGSFLQEIPVNRAAIFAGIRALRLNDGSDISDIVVTRELLDQIGGVHTSSLPYFNTLVAPLSSAGLGLGFTGDIKKGEVADLIAAGISVMGNNKTRTNILTGTIVTTYKTNIKGQEDLTYKFLNYVDTASAAREYTFNSLDIDFAQSRLTDAESIGGYDFTTEGGIKAAMKSYYAALSSAPFVLYRGGVIGATGKTVAEAYEDSLVVTIDLAEGQFTVQSIAPILTQTREINAPLAITFNI